MSKNRVIYNSIGTFISSNVSSGYCFLTADGVPVNSFTNLSDFNLIFSLHRTYSHSYGFNHNRVDLKSLGNFGTISRPITSSPDVNLSFNYYQAGIINELRCGIGANYPKSGIIGNDPLYGTGRVSPIYHLINRGDDKGIDNSIGWPPLCRDSKNIFIATRKDNFDLNSTGNNFNYYNDNVDVFAFGDCYLTNYKTQCSIGTVPQCSMDFICSNIMSYNNGSGQNIPSINPKNNTLRSGIIFNLPNNFEGNGLPTVLSPKDISLNITSSLERNGSLASGLVAYYKLDGNLNDSINNYHATNYNAINISSGIINGGYSFTGNNSYIAPPNISSQFINKGTFSTWIKKNKQIPTGDWDAGSWSLGNSVLNSHYQHPNGNIYDDTFSDSRKNIGPGLSIDKTQWHHFTVVADGTNNFVKYYQNAQLIFSGALGNFGFPPSSKIGQSLSNQYIFDGSLDEIGFWNRDLTSGEVLSLYNNGIGNSYPFFYASSIVNLPIDFNDIKIQGYDITLDLPREPLHSLGYKSPLDRRINFPIYANLNFNVIIGDNNTGSLINHVIEDKEYNINIKLNYQTKQLGGITAINYDFIGAKFNGINLSESIQAKRVATFSFTSELKPNDLRKGFFISGQLGIPTGSYPSTGVLLDENGDPLLLEDGNMLQIDSYDNKLLF